MFGAVSAWHINHYIISDNFEKVLTASDRKRFSYGIISTHEGYMPALQADCVCMEAKVHENGLVDVVISSHCLEISVSSLPVKTIACPGFVTDTVNT